MWLHARNPSGMASSSVPRTGNGAAFARPQARPGAAPPPGLRAIRSAAAARCSDPSDSTSCAPTCERTTSTRDDPRVDVLIEGFDPDAVALARLLAGEGNAGAARGREPEPADARSFASAASTSQPGVDLDADRASRRSPTSTSGRPRSRPRVERLRARGARVSCLGDLLLERWRRADHRRSPAPPARRPRPRSPPRSSARAGIDVAVSAGARAGNLWPTADLLERLTDAAARPGERPTLLLELTSSHLAFMRSSPTLAAVISFWPDHLELHGSLARYRAAKETDRAPSEAGRPRRRQRRRRIGRLRGRNARRPVGVLARPRRRARRLPRPRKRRRRHRPGRPRRRSGTSRRAQPIPANVVAAAAIAAAAGADPADDRAGHRRRRRPAWRAQPSRHARAAFPSSTTAWPPRRPRPPRRSRRYPDRSIVLIAGGLDDAGGGNVHATPRRERALLEQACDVIARVARVVVLFGEAGPRLAPLLERRQVELIETSDLEAAVTAAAQRRGRRDGGGLLPALPGLARRSRALRRRSFAGSARTDGLGLVDRPLSSRRSSKYGFTYFFNSQNPSTAKNRRLNISGPPRFAETDCPTDPSE